MHFKQCIIIEFKMYFLCELRNILRNFMVKLLKEMIAVSRRPKNPNLV